MQLFFEAVNIEARARDEGVLPDLESYIDVRRDTSGKYIDLTAIFSRHLIILTLCRL